MWVFHLPLAGNTAHNRSLGKRVLDEPDGQFRSGNESLHWLGTGKAVTYTKDFASQLLPSLLWFLTILLVLLFVYQHGDSLGRQVLASSRKLFGEKGSRYTLHATAAYVRPVNGMMLIGLGKGLLMGLVMHLSLK